MTRLRPEGCDVGEAMPADFVKEARSYSTLYELGFAVGTVYLGFDCFVCELDGGLFVFSLDVCFVFVYYFETPPEGCCSFI